MKWILLLSMIALMAFGSCKCRQKKTQADVNDVTVTLGSTKGYVSHQYRETGCATVVIIPGDEEATLIPVKGLPADFDVDGKQLLFDYTLLRMPQPEGCSKGIPAELFNISLVE